MIIVCPDCSTKFNFNSDRIPDGGTKVRCARCKYVFLVEKPVDLETPPVEDVETFTAAPATSLTEQTSPTDSFDDQSGDDTDFCYDKFQELDTETTESETFTFGAETETEDENFSFKKSPEEPESTIEKVLAAETEQPVAAEAVAKEEIVDEPATAVEPPTAAKAPAQPVEEKKGYSFFPMLLLLILGILIVGGVYVYINGPDQLNQTIQQFFGQQTNRPVQTGQITISNQEGKFIKNEHNGDFFLIHGEVINNFSQPRAAIQVKGVIFDQNGKPLVQKTVFCGNPISLQELQTLSFVELEKIMGNQFGKDLSNMKIDSKKMLPFDIVFKDLPQNLSEFSVEVTSSEAVTK